RHVGPRRCRRWRRTVRTTAGSKPPACAWRASSTAPPWRRRRVVVAACACRCARWAPARRCSGCWTDAGSRVPRRARPSPTTTPAPDPARTYCRPWPTTAPGRRWNSAWPASPPPRRRRARPASWLPAASGRDVLQHVVGRRHAELARRLDEQLADDAVLGVQGEAARADAHAIAAGVHFKAQGTGEVGIAVGDQLQAVRCIQGAAPGLQHERVVDRHADHVHATAAEFVEALDEAGQVLLR